MRRALVTLALVLVAAPVGAQARRVTPVGGLHLGGPVGASLAVGAAIGIGGERSRDIVLLAEPGLKGDRVSMGYVAIEQLGTILSARATFLRMRRDPAPTGYVGLEVQYAPLFVVGARVGAFAPLRRDRGQRPTLLANFSIGI